MNIVRNVAVLSLSMAGGAAAQNGSDYECVITPRVSVELGSSESGVLAELLVERGDRVEQGQLVAALDSDVEVLTAELTRLRAHSDVELQSSRVQADYRSRELQRLDDLRSDGAVPEQVYDEAAIERQLADLALESRRVEQQSAQIEYQRAQANLSRRRMTSPVTGVVVEVRMAEGEYVYEQSAVMTIAQVDPLYVECFVPVARFGEIENGMWAEVRPEDPIDETFRAQVVVVDQVFDAASRTFGVRLELPNADYGLPAGLRSTVRFLSDPAVP